MKIFITRSIPSEGIEMLKSHPNVELDIYEEDKKIPREVLLERVKGADIILSILTEKMDAELMDAAGNQLKMIANYAVGFNNIDLEAAKERGITVTNAPGEEIGLTVAEHTIALMLGLAHRMVEGDDFARAGKYEAWGPKMMLGTDMHHKTIGIIGAGRIGSQVAKQLHHGFDMKVVYTNQEANTEIEEELGATRMELEDLLKEADFVSLHVPLLESTKHLISEDQLKMMKKTAFLVNTARGPVVDELALVKALEGGEIAGAALDVFECEPLIDCNPDDTHELRKLKNVILTPHIASATIETRQAMSRQAAKNIIAFIDGKDVPNKVG